MVISLRLVPGRAYSFLYPRHNFKGVPHKLEPRRLFVTSIRDIAVDRLDGTTIVLNPLLQRGQYLVTGIDLDKSEERSFYLESMEEVRETAAEPPTYAVVDWSTVHQRTNDPLFCQMFAAGRGGDAVAVRILSPELSPFAATSQKDKREAIQRCIAENAQRKRKGNRKARH